MAAKHGIFIALLGELSCLGGPTMMMCCLLQCQVATPCRSQLQRYHNIVTSTRGGKLHSQVMCWPRQSC